MLATSPPANDKLYTGQQQEGGDPSLGLYNYKARYYSPTLQRFLSEDPLGFGGGSANLYTYANNDPVDYSDPTGLGVRSHA